MTRKDFQAFANVISAMNPIERSTIDISKVCLKVFSEQNPRFDAERFLKACGFADYQIDVLKTQGEVK